MIIKKLPAELNIHAIPGVNVARNTAVIVSAVRLHGAGVDVEVRSTRHTLAVRSRQDKDAFDAVMRLSHRDDWEVSDSFLNDWENFIHHPHDHRR